MEQPHYSLLQALAALPVSALTFFGLLALEVWRVGRHRKLSSPSIALKPWDMPIGLFQFVFASFLFSSIWALGFALVRDGIYLAPPVQYLGMSVGGLIAIYAARRVFPARFA